MDIFKKGKKLTAEDVAKAFNQHRDQLCVSTVNHCCGRGKFKIVGNQQVLLRRMLNTLGFEDKEIDGILYAK